MKLLKNFNQSWLWGLMIVFFSTAVISCDDDDPNTPAVPEDIVTLAQGTGNLSSLVSALTKFPDLVTTLSGNGTFTVFAPSDAAFDALLVAIGQTSIDDVPEDVLRDILEYHVIATAALQSTDLTDGQMAATVNGASITVSLTNGVFINQAEVITPNVEASNGVVHIIDAVLVPQDILDLVGTIVAPAFFNKDFSTLIAAVNAADEDILSVLLGNGPSDMGITLFAPTNAAFEAAGITALPDAATLSAVLKYHVLDGTVGSGDLPAGSANITTLNGDFYLSNVAGGVFINGSTQVGPTDISGSNGVVHVINRTLLPPSQNIAEIVSASAAADPAQFTLLLAALETADLTATFTGVGPFTVFAPTDAAFQAAGFADVAAVEAADPSALAAILTHHVVKASARVFSTDLTDEQVITMLNDQNVTVDLDDLTIQDAAGSDPASGLVAAQLNILATNGVIHVIDKVLLPND